MRWGRQQKAGIWAAAGFALLYLLDPVWTIARQNVEVWSAENGLDRLLVNLRLDSVAAALQAAVQFVAGDFALGFAAGSILFAMWDPIGRWIAADIFRRLRLGPVKLRRVDMPVGSPIATLTMEASLVNESKSDIWASFVSAVVSVDGQTNPLAETNTRPFLIPAGETKTFDFAVVPGVPRGVTHVVRDDVVVRYGPRVERLAFELQHRGDTIIDVTPPPDGGDTAKQAYSTKHLISDHTRVRL